MFPLPHRKTVDRNRLPRRPRGPRQGVSIGMEALERRILLSDDLLDPSGVRKPAAWVDVPTARTIVPARPGPAVPSTTVDSRSSRDAVAVRVMGAPGQLVAATFTLAVKYAQYHNEVGLYRVDDPTGRIGTL